MATQTYKVLGQAAPAATTSTDLYTVPAATTAVISSIVIANRVGTIATFRVSVSVAGAAVATKDYLVYDAAIAGAGFVTLTLGLTLGATDVIRVYSSNSSTSFSVFGSELA